MIRRPLRILFPVQRTMPGLGNEPFPVRGKREARGMSRRGASSLIPRREKIVLEGECGLKTRRWDARDGERLSECGE